MKFDPFRGRQNTPAKLSYPAEISYSERTR